MLWPTHRLLCNVCIVGYVGASTRVSHQAQLERAECADIVRVIELLVHVQRGHIVRRLHFRGEARVTHNTLSGVQWLAPESYLKASGASHNLAIGLLRRASRAELES